MDTRDHNSKSHNDDNDFKEQMAARYQERLSMGFKIPEIIQKNTKGEYSHLTSSMNETEQEVDYPEIKYSSFSHSNHNQPHHVKKFTLSQGIVQPKNSTVVQDMERKPLPLMESDNAPPSQPDFPDKQKIENCIMKDLIEKFEQRKSVSDMNDPEKTKNLDKKSRSNEQQVTGRVAWHQSNHNSELEQDLSTSRPSSHSKESKMVANKGGSRYAASREIKAVNSESGTRSSAEREVKYMNGENSSRSSVGRELKAVLSDGGFRSSISRRVSKKGASSTDERKTILDLGTPCSSIYETAHETYAKKKALAKPNLNDEPVDNGTKVIESISNKSKTSIHPEGYSKYESNNGEAVKEKNKPTEMLPGTPDKSPLLTTPKRMSLRVLMKNKQVAKEDKANSVSAGVNIDSPFNRGSLRRKVSMDRQPSKSLVKGNATSTKAHLKSQPQKQKQGTPPNIQRKPLTRRMLRRVPTNDVDEYEDNETKRATSAMERYLMFLKRTAPTAIPLPIPALDNSPLANSETPRVNDSVWTKETSAPLFKSPPISVRKHPEYYEKLDPDPKNTLPPANRMDNTTPKLQTDTRSIPNPLSYLRRERSKRDKFESEEYGLQSQPHLNHTITPFEREREQHKKRFGSTQRSGKQCDEPGKPPFPNISKSLRSASMSPPKSVLKRDSSRTEAWHKSSADNISGVTRNTSYGTVGTPSTCDSGYNQCLTLQPSNDVAKIQSIGDSKLSNNGLATKSPSRSLSFQDMLINNKLHLPEMSGSRSQLMLRLQENASLSPSESFRSPSFHKPRRNQSSDVYKSASHKSALSKLPFKGSNMSPHIKSPSLTYLKRLKFTANKQASQKAQNVTSADKNLISTGPVDSYTEENSCPMKSLRGQYNETENVLQSHKQLESKPSADKQDSPLCVGDGQVIDVVEPSLLTKDELADTNLVPMHLRQETHTMNDNEEDDAKDNIYDVLSPVSSTDEDDNSATSVINRLKRIKANRILSLLKNPHRLRQSPSNKISPSQADVIRILSNFVDAIGSGEERSRGTEVPASGTLLEQSTPSEFQEGQVSNKLTAKDMMAKKTEGSSPIKKKKDGSQSQLRSRDEPLGGYSRIHQTEVDAVDDGRLLLEHNREGTRHAELGSRSKEKMLDTQALPSVTNDEMLVPPLTTTTPQESAAPAPGYQPSHNTYCCSRNSLASSFSETSYKGSKDMSRGSCDLDDMDDGVSPELIACISPEGEYLTQRDCMSKSMKGNALVSSSIDGTTPSPRHDMRSIEDELLMFLEQEARALSPSRKSQKRLKNFAKSGKDKTDKPYKAKTKVERNAETKKKKRKKDENEPKLISSKVKEKTATPVKTLVHDEPKVKPKKSRLSKLRAKTSDCQFGKNCFSVDCATLSPTKVSVTDQSEKTISPPSWRHISEPQSKSEAPTFDVNELTWHDSKQFKPVYIYHAKKLTSKPTYRWPMKSSIPLISSSRRRSRLDVLSQHRRCLDDLTSQNPQCKIPMTTTFIQSLKEAASEEWALHSWTNTDSSITSKHKASSTYKNMILPDSSWALQMFHLPKLYCTYLSVWLAMVGTAYLGSHVFNCNEEEYDIYCTGDDIKCLADLIN